MGLILRSLSLFLMVLTISVAMRTVLEHVKPQMHLRRRSEWTHLGNLDDEELLQFHIAVKQRNMDVLEEEILDRSDPKSANYGIHMTKEEVEELVRPHHTSFSVIKKWLASHEIEPEQIQQSNDWVTVEMTSLKAKEVFEASFSMYQHNLWTNYSVARAPSYTVPVEVSKHVDFVGGIVNFPRLPTQEEVRKRFRKLKKEEPGIGVTPRILRDRYNIGSTRGVSKLNKMAVAQFLGEYYSAVDLEEFFLLFFWPAVGNSVEEVVGDNWWYYAGIEANLDIQYIMSIGLDVPVWYFSTQGYHQNQEPFLIWANIVANYSDNIVPRVISVSYGDTESSVTYSYAHRVSAEFAKLTARGISLIFASGDDGVGCNDKLNRFAPVFPATSPWVTAVGATTTEFYFELGVEIAAGFSGGGFSDYFEMPEWQKKAVSAYFDNAKHLPMPSFYNASGRAYPDVATLGTGYTIIAYLAPLMGIDGTSCSAPTFAGIVALLNDLRLQAGRDTLGFLNPWMYQVAVNKSNAFFDVTVGCNPGGCPNNGFCAAPGWDPVVGLGTPLYSELATLL